MVVPNLSTSNAYIKGRVPPSVTHQQSVVFLITWAFNPWSLHHANAVIYIVSRLVFFPHGPSRSWVPSVIYGRRSSPSATYFLSTGIPIVPKYPHVHFLIPRVPRYIEDFSLASLYITSTLLPEASPIFLENISVFTHVRVSYSPSIGPNLARVLSCRSNLLIP